MKLQPGTLLQNGKYRIEGVLGQGGFGITYLAEHTSLNGKVCIKEFYPQVLCSRSESGSVTTISDSSMMDYDIFKRRFLDEARRLHRIHHDHIVAVSDLFEENFTAYFVMEYIEGETLQKKIQRAGALSEDDARRYIGQVADALAHIHSLDMLHLDIKPANIMIRASDDRVVVIDFGLARHYNAKSGEQTTTNIAAHSPGYAPFEQSLHDSLSHFCPASDIYSLGATLYALVTGKRPPEAATIPSDGIPSLPVHLSTSLKQTIAQAMEYGIKRRPQSIAEFNKILNFKRGSTRKNTPILIICFITFAALVAWGINYFREDRVSKDDVVETTTNHITTRDVNVDGETLLECTNSYYGYSFRCPTYMKIKSQSTTELNLISDDGKTELKVRVKYVEDSNLKDSQILYSIQDAYEDRFLKDKNIYIHPQNIESIKGWVVASGYLSDDVCLYDKSVIANRITKDGRSVRLIVSIIVTTKSKNTGIIAYHIRDYFVVNKTGIIEN